MLKKKASKKGRNRPDKSLLLGATMLVDLEYFEVKKENR